MFQSKLLKDKTFNSNSCYTFLCIKFAFSFFTFNKKCDAVIKTRSSFLFCAFVLHLFSTKINDQYIKCYLSTQNVDKIGTGMIAMPPVDIVYIASVTMLTEIATTDVKMDMRETYAKNVCYIFFN